MNSLSVSKHIRDLNKKFSFEVLPTVECNIEYIYELILPHMPVGNMISPENMSNFDGNRPGCFSILWHPSSLAAYNGDVIGGSGGGARNYIICRHIGKVVLPIFRGLRPNCSFLITILTLLTRKELSDAKMIPSIMLLFACSVSSSMRDFVQKKGIISASALLANRTAPYIGYLKGDFHFQDSSFKHVILRPLHFIFHTMILALFCPKSW